MSTPPDTPPRTPNSGNNNEPYSPPAVTSTPAPSGAALAAAAIASAVTATADTAAATAAASKGKSGFSFFKKKDNTSAETPASPSSSASSANISTPTFVLPPVDVPCPSHYHYQLTIEMPSKDIYTISVEGRTAKSLYQCASMMESLDGSQKTRPTKKTSGHSIICCTLNPRITQPNTNTNTNSTATIIDHTADIEFCQTILEMNFSQNVAKTDIARILTQIDQTQSTYKQLNTALLSATHSHTILEHEVELWSQQQMSDELTQQFLRENVQTLESQYREEVAQTEQLSTMMTTNYDNKTKELIRIQERNTEIDREYERLKEEKRELTNEAKRLTVEVAELQRMKEARKEEYLQMIELIQKLKKI